MNRTNTFLTNYLQMLSCDIALHLLILRSICIDDLVLCLGITRFFIFLIHIHILSYVINLIVLYHLYFIIKSSS